MQRSLRTWLFLPVLLSLALVIAACDADDDADDDVVDTDDTEIVEDTDDATDDAVVDDPDDAATDDEAVVEEDDADDAITEDDADVDTDAEADDAADVEAGDYPDVNDLIGGAIMFGDFNWDSAMFHNRVVQYIIEEGYGHDTDVLPGSTLPILQGLEDNEIHAVTEMWVQNMPEWYHDEVEAGTYIDLGANYVGALQGWFVPTYVIEGDEERGIEPLAPDLSHVDDLHDVWEIFEDEEDSSMGRVYNGVGGWEATEINDVRLRSYGLDEYYNSFLPGSEAALFASLAREYERGEPWIGYLWTPSWPFAEYDMTFIEEPEYSEECWEEISAAAQEAGSVDEPCGFPEVDVNVVISTDLDEHAPHLVELLTAYESNMELTNAALLYISENDATPDEAAEWWLVEYEDVWTAWVPDDVAQQVLDSLQ